MRVKNARASRALRQALDPSQYWLASLVPTLLLYVNKISEKNSGAPLDQILDPLVLSVFYTSSRVRVIRLLDQCPCYSLGNQVIVGLSDLYLTGLGTEGLPMVISLESIRHAQYCKIECTPNYTIKEVYSCLQGHEVTKISTSIYSLDFYPWTLLYVLKMD